MHADIHKPNWLFRGLMLLSVGVHLIGLIQVTRIYRPNLVSRIELTLQSIQSRPQPKVVVPPAHFEQPKENFVRQPSPLEVEQNSIIAAPQYRPPKPVLSERLQKIPSLPQNPIYSDPMATVWEEEPETVQTSVVPAPSLIQQDDGLAEIQYRNRIKQQIDDAIEYPQRARRRNLEGVVKVIFTIGDRGELVSISVSTSSGSRILDRSAIKAVQTAAPFDPPPKGSVTLELPIKYKLT
jgi:protein TonB